MKIFEDLRTCRFHNQSLVCSAAVSSLGKFGAHADELLPSILVLLRRCLLDSDDEVRDRATYYIKVLEQNQKALCSQYILNCECSFMLKPALNPVKNSSISFQLCRFQLLV